MGRIAALLASCHPLPTVAVTAIASALAAGVGLTAPRVLLLGAAVLAGQLSIGWSNDAIDAARDDRAGRTDKPVARGELGRRTAGRAAGVALIVAVVLSLWLGTAAATALLTLVAAGWAYNLGLKATVCSGLTYLIGFGALPLAPYLAHDGHLPPWWVPTTGALLGLAAHVANVLPDLRADAAADVRGLPHRLGVRRAVALMAIALAATTVVLGLGPRSLPTAFAVVAATAGAVAGACAVVTALRNPDSPAPFRIMIAVAVLDVALVLVIAS